MVKSRQIFFLQYINLNLCLNWLFLLLKGSLLLSYTYYIKCWVGNCETTALGETVLHKLHCVERSPVELALRPRAGGGREIKFISSLNNSNTIKV